MIESANCGTDQLKEFLANTMTGVQLASFEEHLQRCSSCRRQLDEAIASPCAWQDVRSALSSRAIAEDASALTSETTRDSSGLDYYRGLLSPTDRPDMLGRIANYEIVGVLGHGGMGVVFKGLDTALNRFVAVKVLSPQFAASASARQRFLREAQAAAAVVHEHVIAIHAVATWQETPYLVMPYVRGESLQKRLAKQGALNTREVLRIGMQVASGLAAAHAQGLIHRDVKPANILLDEGIDRVLLADFGLARAIDDIRLTRTDALIGTPQYMSPEQAQDLSLDYRTDLFSLGSVLYEAGTGRPAFQAATSYGVMRKITDHSPVAMRELNSDVPEWLQKIVERLMMKQREQRFPKATEVENLLKQCLAHVEQPQLAPLPPLAEKCTLPIPWTPRSIVMIVASASLLLAALSLMMMPAAQAPQTTTNTSAENGSAQEPTDRTPQQFSSAKEAFAVGVAFYNSRNFKASRAPFEAVLQLTDDDQMRLKAYEALIPAYRQIPEFEPFQIAAEFIVQHATRDSQRSLMRRSFLSFAFQRGQLDNLSKRYEERLAKNRDDFVAVYLLSEIYTLGERNPKRAIELIRQLNDLRAAKINSTGTAKPTVMPVDQAAKVVREKVKLARQYALTKDHQKAAELYEEIAPLDPTTQAWNLKEAADQWLKANDKEQALRVVLKAEEAKPEARNDQLVHFFHRSMGDILMSLDRPKAAIPYYEIAIQKTNIEGYVNDTKASLQQARERSQRSEN